MTNRILGGWGLNSCGIDATIPFSTGARRWRKLASFENSFLAAASHLRVSRRWLHRAFDDVLGVTVCPRRRFAERRGLRRPLRARSNSRKWCDLPRIDGLELRSIDGDARCNKQIKLAAQRHKLAADFTNGLAVVFAEIWMVLKSGANSEWAARRVARPFCLL
jgi:AraC-like DNA-binding protein